MKKLLIFAFAFMSCINTAFGQTYANPYKLMTYFKNTDKSSLVVLSAHRGFHYKYDDTPENSLQAISRAANNGIEAIELDIKTTSDKIPVMSHDDNLARITYNSYSPFNGTNSNPSSTLYPAVNKQTWATVKTQILRDIEFNPKNQFNISYENGNLRVGLKDNETVSSLSNVLNHIRTNKLRLVVMLDIKSVADAQACWNVVSILKDCSGRYFNETVIFKMSLKALGYSDPLKGLVTLNLLSVSNGVYKAGTNTKLKFVPVYNGNDRDSLKAAGTADFYNIEEKISTLVPGYLYPEINAKTINGTTNWFSHLNTAYYNAGISRAKGIFSPTPEVPAYTWGSTNYINGYYKNTGVCCYRLSDVFFTSAIYGASETSDPRQDIKSPLMSNFSVIITDDPLNADTYFKGLGQRTTSIIRSNTDPCVTSARIAAEESAVDEETRLLVYPNPSVDNFTLQYWADDATEATVRIFDKTGQMVLQQNLTLEKGINEPTFDVKSLLEGNYVVNMQVGGKVITKRLGLIK